ncbi:hypothetical protein PZH32_12325, partial [Adlercreutzia equolifaciens]|uniref:hypothetical protein n=1 Tax=Adlercreutzia equolifaciens TaxID=446660 RepID=UPI0023B02FB7
GVLNFFDCVVLVSLLWHSMEDDERYFWSTVYRFALKWHRIFEFGAVFIAISFYWKEGKSTLSVD